MPVIDHPVHESVRIGQDFRYGCHNRSELQSGYWAQDGWIHYGPDGMSGSMPRWVWVPQTMSTTCRYDLSLTDAACDGCRERGVGETYFKKVTEESK